MGLFDKKYCDICGEKIGLLGNRKLENGNLCKNCAKKLSPWFSDRRNSTVEEIKAQLAYREANQEKVAAFHTTRTLGTNTKVLLDEDAGKFMVTRARDLQEANPDVLDFADVTGCNLDIDESRSELKREDKDGEEVSYNPPRYEYSYDFYITIFVNNPYFDEMRFQLNSSSVDITPPPAMRPGMTEHLPMVARVTSSIMGMRTLITTGVLALLFLVLYKCIPNRKASFKSQCPGALISSLAWSIFSLAFSMYLDIALAASNMYGSLTMIVFIMIWMYFCMWILLIGAEINAYFEDKLRKLQNAAIEHFMENKETNKEAGK